MGRLSLVIALVASVAGCAPTVDGPAERQRILDRADGDRLTAQLSALPGVVRSEVMLRRPIADPLSTATAVPPGISLVVIVDDKADRASIGTSARQLAVAAAPGVDPTIVVEVGAFRPELASVGPFSVEARSRTPLKVALAIALALIAALATWIAIRERRRTSA